VIGISVAALRKPTPLSLNRVCCSWEDGFRAKQPTSLSRIGLVLTLSPLQSGAWNQRAAARAPLDTRSNSTKPREATIPCRSGRYERRCRAENIRPRVGVCGPRGSAFWGARRRRASPAGTWRTRACPASSAEQSSASRARRCWPGLTGTSVPLRQNHSPSRNGAPAPRHFARCRAHAPDCRSGVGTPAATSSLQTCSLQEFARAGRCS
jgi:hypothetical protein